MKIKDLTEALAIRGMPETLVEMHNMEHELLALREQVKRYEATLRSIAKQWIGDEIDKEQIGGDPDYQAGYEGCVTTARAVLTQIEQGEAE